MSPLLAKISGLIIVAVLALLIRRILAPHSKFSGFLQGDDGLYSLSRLQACLWAYIIIAYQISALIAVVSFKNYTDFSLVFSEEALWLLGLSLGGYITVKGITVGQQTSEKATTITRKLNGGEARASWADLISSDGKLDLSRFQMLIWTIIALVTFIISYFHYVQEIFEIGRESITDASKAGTFSKMFPKFSEADGTPVLPTVDMSFIVLMGLSQGAYIGRKLVPSYKVDEFTKEYYADLEKRKSILDTGITFRRAEYQLLLASPATPTSKKIDITNELNELDVQKKKLQDEIDSLNKSLTKQ